MRPSVRVAIISVPIKCSDFFKFYLLPFLDRMMLLLQITTESFQTSPEFSSQWFSQKYVCNFLKL